MNKSIEESVTSTNTQITTSCAKELRGEEGCKDVCGECRTLEERAVVGTLVKPHDRFKNAALFLCGYLSYPNERVDEVASIIRRYAALNEPYELCTCQKCKTEVELQYYEGDEDECSYPHYYCPNSNCRANYYDKSGKESWKELDSHYEDIEESFKQRQFQNDDDGW